MQVEINTIIASTGIAEKFTYVANGRKCEIRVSVSGQNVAVVSGIGISVDAGKENGVYDCNKN